MAHPGILASHVRSPAAVVAGILLLATLAPAARGQTTSALMLDPWAHGGWGETLDRVQYQAQADVRGTGDAPGGRQTTQIFLWDSVGRFQLPSDAPLGQTIGYRYLTINTDSDSPSLPDTLDDLSLAFGMKISEWAGGRAMIVLGAGYSGDNLFADPDGVYGVGHLLWERRLGDDDSLVLSLDHDGNSPLLPDVPLPGFALVRYGDDLSWRVGFPASSFNWAVTPDLSVSAAYAVPYTADVAVRYRLSESWSLFAGYGSLFNAFQLDGGDRTDRLFFQQQRVEVGVQFVEGDLLGRGIYLDAALTVGYAFDQAWSSGFDVRDLDPVGRTDDTPYVGLVLRGRF